MKILVTGGSGLVGSSLKSIQNQFHDYNFIFLSSHMCDLTNYNQTLNYFEQEKPDFVIHLAANVGGLFKNMKYKVDMLETNLSINSNVLKASYIVGVKKLIACLSTCIFPDKISYPINETMLHLGPPHYSNDSYAYAKRILEIQCRAYREQYGCNYVCVIPTNIYGLNDNFHLEDAHVIPALIHKCWLAKQSGNNFVVSGSGTPLRQFIYSEDLAKLIMIVLEKYDDVEPIILSVGEEEEVSIGQIAQMIADKFDYSENMIFDLSLPDGQFKKTANNSKLLNLIGNFEFIKMKQGIDKTIEWFIENYNFIRK